MKNPSRHSGFTLIELLVVIGIISLLAALLLPAVNRAQNMGKITLCKAQMQQIAQGLDSYLADFGDYPRLTGITPANTPTGVFPNVTGPQILCWGLAALGPATQDGADGPGFRTLASVGRVRGPYIVPDKFKFTAMDDTAEILDPWGNVFLYYPARPGHPSISGAHTFVADSTNAADGNPATPLYDAVYSWYWMNTPANPSTWALVKPGSTNPPSPPSESALETLLGAGSTGAAATPKYTGPYIIWSAGVDGLYGNTDDITTFNQ